MDRQAEPEIRSRETTRCCLDFKARFPAASRGWAAPSRSSGVADSRPPQKEGSTVKGGLRGCRTSE
jgi:hypothetical protein